MSPTLTRQGAGEPSMTILHPGSDEWWARWSPEQRQRSAEIAFRRVRHWTVWVVVALVGLAAAAASMVVDITGPDGFPERPDLVGLVGLAIESFVITSHLLAWRQVGRVCVGAAPPSTLRGLRTATVLATFVGLFTGLAVFFWVALYPAYAFSVSLGFAMRQEPAFGLAHALLAIVAVTAMASACVSVFGWVPLLSLRITDEPDPHAARRS